MERSDSRQRATVHTQGEEDVKHSGHYRELISTCRILGSYTSYSGIELEHDGGKGKGERKVKQIEVKRGCECLGQSCLMLGGESA